MHFKYFGLDKNPFEINPDPYFLYLSEKHREALSHLTYSVIAKKPFLLLTGDVGVGKTTILHYFIKQLRKKSNIFVVSIFNPNLQVKEFYYLLSKELGWQYRSIKSQFLFKFKLFLTNFFRQGKILVIIIDEAQAASEDLLEELRLLSNLVEDEQGLVIILVGQPELIKKLSSQKLYSLQQRFSYRYHLGPFTSEHEVSEYLITRILKAGSPRTRIFTDEAIRLIYQYSKGIPRLINILADHAMLAAYLKEQAIVGPEEVSEALKDADHLFSSPKPLDHLESLATNTLNSAKKSKKRKYLIALFFLPILIMILWFFKEEIFNFWRMHWPN